MKHAFRSHVFSFLAGVLFVVGAILFVRSLSGMLTRPFDALEILLPSPSFPKASKLPAYGQPDWDWTLYTLNGEVVTLAQFKDTPVFINIWATWCHPCLLELPSIQRLSDSLKGEPVAFLLITDEPEGVVRNFLSSRQLSVPVYLQRGKEPKVFQSIGLPATFVLSRDGAAVFRHLGAANWDSDPCREFLRQLM